jgi:hypothetical protein
VSDLIDTVYGDLAVEPTTIADLHIGDVFATEPDYDGEPYPLYEVIQPSADDPRGWLTVETVTQASIICGDRGYFEEADATVHKVVATMYDGIDGREVFDVGQVRFGGLLICHLRDAANAPGGVAVTGGTAWDVFEYAACTGLVELNPPGPQLTLTEDGRDLFEALDPLYRDTDTLAGDWRDHANYAYIL